MRFQVLRHALAPAFVWVLVAFACGATVGQLALQRVQVIEREHPVVIDANGVVIGPFVRSDGGANLAVELEGHPFLWLNATNGSITGSLGAAWYSGPDCSGTPQLEFLSAELTPPTFKSADRDEVLIPVDPNLVPSNREEDRVPFESVLWPDGSCETRTGLASAVPAATVPLPHLTPPFSVVMRSDLQPAP